MEIIKEYIFKLIILFLISLFMIEIFILIILSKRATIIYEETFKETEEKEIQKALEVSQKLQELTNNYLSKFLGDLKLIGIHSLLFNINKANDDNKLDNTNKKIFAATMDTLNEIEELKIFSRIRERSYIRIYEEEFGNNTDKTSIINSLMNNTKHPELNYIAYYNPEMNKMNHLQRLNIEETLDETEKNNIKNIMSILKSIYIKRYVIKRDDTDIIRFFIINKEKMFIYPPTPFNLTQQYFFSNLYFDANCDKEVNPFPLCYYNYLNETFYSKENYTEPNKINLMTMLIEKIHLQKTFGSICIRMRYIKEENDPSIICIGLDFSNLFRTSSFNNIAKYDFGMFTMLNDDNIYPIININEDIYEIILNHFGNEKSHHPLLHIKDSAILKFFHFLY